MHHHFLKKAILYLKDGLNYTLSLPMWSLRRRLFCIIPLFLALRTCTHLKEHPLNQPMMFKNIALGGLADYPIEYDNRLE